MHEVCFLIARTGEILWRDEGSAHHLPDSRARWEAIWHHRSRLTEIAHTHPMGLLKFSDEDRTTMQAIWVALGTDLVFSVVTADAMLRILRDGSEAVVKKEPAWAKQIRIESGLMERNPQERRE